MKLPVDNFELLGVGVGTDGSGVLRTLQKRCECSPLNGFSEETLEKRRSILTRASKTLLDNQQRRKYEEDLRIQGNIRAMGVEIDEHELVAALMLLLEAGHYSECMEIGKEYEDKKTYFFEGGFNSREMGLIMDYAALQASEANRVKRYYQRAAEVLETRIRERARIKERGELTKKMECEIYRLMPFRVLDLLSREDGRLTRDLGISLLERIIAIRGGLEKESNEIMGQEEFKSFFRQIRGYLTVQEQIDIFQKMGSKGSEVGNFIAAIALTASGFAQRKPEKLKEAIGLLEKLGRDEIELVISNIYLLLGDVSIANSKFTNFAEDELKLWCQEVATGSLGQMCAWCQEWLRRDVLNGFKDIDIEADIDAYFGDKDVIEYIESQDRERRGNEIAGQEQSNESQERKTEEATYRRGISYNENEYNAIGRWVGKTKNMQGTSNQDFLGKGTTGLFVILLLTATLTLFAQLNKEENGDNKVGNEVIKKEKSSKVKTKNEMVKADGEEEIRNRIEQWHKIKRNKLLGDEIPNDQRNYFSQRRLSELKREADQLQRLGRRMRIEVEIKNMRIVDRGKDKKEVQTDLIYGEEITDMNGRVIGKIPRRDYSRTYILSKKGESWMLE